MKIEWKILTPDDIDHGPPKPMQCVDGPESHTWKMSIEEGQLTLSTDCRLCQDGLEASTEPEDYEMEAIDVRLDIEVDRGLEDVFVVWWIRPVTR